MSQCVVPNWDVEEGGLDVLRLRPHPTTSNSSGNGLDVPMLDYEMAELTWENGQLSVHGLGRTKPTTLKGPTAGTLESIVNLATRKPPLHPQQYQYQHQQPPDALVPQQKQKQKQGVGMVMRTPVDSCSSGGARELEEEVSVLKETSSVATRVQDASGDWTNISASYLTPSGTTLGADSWHVPTTTLDTCETSSGRPATTINDYDSVSNSHQRESGGGSEEQRKRNNGKSASSTRRSRAAAIHNQSERKRRDKINQKMKMLQKLVPNSNKTDKASMLDEVIEYLKQLQGQVNMMNRMSVIPNSMNMNMNMNMMMPLPAQLALQQQQLQMSMMAAAAAASPMGMGMGMTGIGPMPSMDMNTQGMSLNPMATRQNQLAAPFMGPACWDVADRQLPATTVIDPISTYLACQPQAMTIEAYSRMIALIQQQQQQLASVSKQ